jgi:putative photosynthetic complex assembly protein
MSMSGPTLVGAAVNDKPVIHRRAVAIGLALAGVSVVAAAVVRFVGAPIREPDAAAQTTRLIRFSDGPDGSILVVDTISGGTLAHWAGERGFERGALRALGRERKRRKLPSEAPFELIGRSDGRLTLVDPSTGERLDLESFGPTNAQVFAQLLRAP